MIMQVVFFTTTTTTTTTRTYILRRWEHVRANESISGERSKRSLFSSFLLHKSEGASECFPLILNSICRITRESRRISRESLSNCLCSLPPKALICTQHNCLIRCMNICTLGFSAFHHSLHTVIPSPPSPTLALPSPLLAKSHHVWMDARTQTRTDAAFISFFSTCKLAVLHLNGSH